jgi:hypothetical protein
VQLSEYNFDLNATKQLDDSESINETSTDIGKSWRDLIKSLSL